MDRRTVPFAFTLLSVASVRPTAVRAQAAEPVPVGADVRVRALPGPAWRRGALVALDPERLILRPAANGWPARPDTIPRSHVERLEVRRPTPDRTARTVSGGFLGVLAGALLGGVVGYQATTCGGCEDSGFGAVVGVPLGGLTGLVVGAGVARIRAHYWEPVALVAAPPR